MKEFKKICKMTQPEVKKYMNKFFLDNHYAVVNENGFLYAIPEDNRVSVLLVAHMDTVHKEQCKEIKDENGKLSSPQGIGGDDRCGVYMIMNIVKELRCPVLLTEDEEKGGIGANKFVGATYDCTDENGKKIKKKYINELDVNYMIEFDRRGSNDAVYYSCDNKDFKKFVEENSGMKENFGSYSDISTIMPASKIAGVNFSCGYYNPHQTNEYVMFDEMTDVIEAAKILIKEPCEKPFEYVAKVWPKYDYKSSYRGSGYSQASRYHQYSLYDRDYSTYNSDCGMIESLELELEVLWNDAEGKEQIDICYGKNKAECWFNFFMANQDVCMEMVTDWSWT